jgi:hypothetical protein
MKASLLSRRLQLGLQIECMQMTSDDAGIQFRTLAADYTALGNIVSFVTQRSPFGGFKANDVITAVKGQIATGSHVCAFRGKPLVGYCGWLPITNEVGRLWLDGKGALFPVPFDQSDAVALTIVCAENPRVLRGLIRTCRDLGRGRQVFFKRVYADVLRQERRQVLKVA